VAKMKKLTKKQELKLWLKITRGNPLPAGAYNIEEVETEEL
jgi:hypothetical protein